MWRTVLIALACAIVGCEPDDDGTEVVFADVAAPPPGGIVLDAASAADARVALFDALDDSEGAPAVTGTSPWRTRVRTEDGAAPDEVARAGGTYAVRGDSDLRLDVRLGAGDRGASAGGTVSTGAERAMIQVKIDDPRQVSARFRLSIVADDGPGGAHPREVTPRYLTRPVPKGRYRAWVDVPSRGGRFLAGVTVLDDAGDPVAHAWSSPIVVVRPWRAE